MYLMAYCLPVPTQLQLRLLFYIVQGLAKARWKNSESIANGGVNFFWSSSFIFQLEMLDECSAALEIADPKEIFTDPQHCSESGYTVQQATLPLSPIAVLFPPAGWRPPWGELWKGISLTASQCWTKASLCLLRNIFYLRVNKTSYIMNYRHQNDSLLIQIQIK